MKRVLFLLAIGLVYGVQAYNPSKVAFIPATQDASIAQTITSTAEPLAQGTCQVTPGASCTTGYNTFCQDADKTSEWYCENCLCGKWVTQS